MFVERTLGGLHAFLEEIVASQFAKGIPSTIDLGCGTGAWLHRIKKSVEGQVVGIDYEKPAGIGDLDLRQFDINSDAPDSLGKYALAAA